MDDYLAARYVSKPLRILDCDYPVDSGSAVIFTTEERARDLAQAGRARRVVRADRDPRPATSRSCRDMVHTAPAQTAKRPVGSAPTSRRPTSTPRSSTTASRSSCSSGSRRSGSAARARRGAFVDEGNTRLGGSLPVNTDGGACNVGRRHGANFCIEATRQLRGAVRRASGRRRRGRGVHERGRPVLGRRHPHQGLMTLASTSRTGNEGVRKVALGAERSGGDRRDVGHRSEHDKSGDPTRLELGVERQQRLDLEVAVEPLHEPRLTPFERRRIRRRRAPNGRPRSSVTGRPRHASPPTRSPRRSIAR